MNRPCVQAGQSPQPQRPNAPWLEALQALPATLHGRLAAPNQEGLRRALGSAPMALLCAEGSSYLGATAALPAFFAAAQWPAVVIPPEALAAHGAGAFRLAHVLLLWAPDSGAAAAALALAARYHCPVGAFGPDATASQTMWALPTAEAAPGADAGVFATAYVAWVALALEAAQLRAVASGALPHRLHDDFTAWHDALAHCVPHLRRIDLALNQNTQNGASAASWARRCQGAREVQVVADAASVAAAQAWAQEIRRGWPPVRVVLAHERGSGSVAAQEAMTLHLRGPQQSTGPLGSSCFGGLISGPDGGRLQLPELPVLMWPLWAYWALRALSHGAPP